MFLALESRLALWLLLLREYGRRDVTSVSRPGFVRLATSTSCFLEPLLWEKPATVWEVQLLRQSHCQEVESGYFESPHGERRPARARHSSHLKPTSRHVSEKKPSWMWTRPKDHSQNWGHKVPRPSQLQPTEPPAEAPALMGVKVEGSLPFRPCLISWPTKLCASANDFRFHH